MQPNSIRDRSQFWDQAAEGDNEHFAQKIEFHDPVAVEPFQQFVAKDAAILDFGCGYGRVSNILYQAGFKHIYGVDISPLMIQRLQKTFPHLSRHASVYDGVSLPFANASFDAMTAFTVLNAVPNQDEVENLFNEFRRVLKQNGVLYLCEFLLADFARDIKRYDAYQKQFPDAPYGTFAHSSGQVFRHFSVEMIEDLSQCSETLWHQQKHFTSMNGNPCVIGDWIFRY